MADGDGGRHRSGLAGSVTVIRSGCAPPVAMVQATDLWESDDVAGRGRLHGPGLGTILAEREMCSALVVLLQNQGREAGCCLFIVGPVGKPAAFHSG